MTSGNDIRAHWFSGLRVALRMTSGGDIRGHWLSGLRVALRMMSTAPLIVVANERWTTSQKLRISNRPIAFSPRQATPSPDVILSGALLRGVEGSMERKRDPRGGGAGLMEGAERQHEAAGSEVVSVVVRVARLIHTNNFELCVGGAFVRGRGRAKIGVATVGGFHPDITETSFTIFDFLKHFVPLSLCSIVGVVASFPKVTGHNRGEFRLIPGFFYFFNVFSKIQTSRHLLSRIMYTANTCQLHLSSVSGFQSRMTLRWLGRSVPPSVRSNSKRPSAPTS